MAWFLKEFRESGIENIPKIFVETGAYKGEGIENYLKTDYFEEIHSIELSEKWFEYCKNKYQDYPKVKLHLGDSARVLEELDLPKEPIIFYLDAHYSGGTTAGEDIDNGCPVLRELDFICRRNVKGDIVVVDDMRLMGNAMWSGTEGCESYPRTFFDFTHANVSAMVDVFKRYNLADVRCKVCHGIDRMIFLF